MRVTLVSAHSDPLRGGAESYLAKLADRFVAQGHSVGPDGEVVLATVPFVGCDFYQPHGGILAASIPPHYESMGPVMGFVRRFNPTRVVHFMRLRAKEAATIAGATVLSLSPRVERDLARFYPGAKSTLLRVGVDLARFCPGGERRGLLFVATNPRLKGLATARRAAELVGAELKVARPGEDVAELYRQAEVLVHPSYYDTASLVVLEALASGTVPITTVRDGNADLAVEGGGAALERPGDPVALAAAIEEVRGRIDPVRARKVAERFGEIEMLDEVVACVCSS